MKAWRMKVCGVEAWGWRREGMGEEEETGGAASDGVRRMVDGAQVCEAPARGVR